MFFFSFDLVSFFFAGMMIPSLLELNKKAHTFISFYTLCMSLYQPHKGCLPGFDLYFELSFFLSRQKYQRIGLEFSLSEFNQVC